MRNRTYLFVPPEEVAEVERLGASWNPKQGFWSIDPRVDSLASFARWIPYKEGDRLEVISRAAFIASVTVPCHACGQETEAVCIHCKGGMVEGVPCGLIIVEHIMAVDGLLASVLGALHPQLRQVRVDMFFRDTPKDQRLYVDLFMNHCTHCGTPQEIEPQLSLEVWDDHRNWGPQGHMEGGGRIRLTLLHATVMLSGIVTYILRWEEAEAPPS